MEHAVEVAAKTWDYELIDMLGLPRKLSSGTWSLLGVENEEPICTEDSIQETHQYDASRLQRLL